MKQFDGVSCRGGHRGAAGTVAGMSLVARLWLVAAVLSGAVLLVLPATSFAARTVHVDVVDDAYDDRNRDGNAEEGGEENRNLTVVTAGDTVVWEWLGDNKHTVTSHSTSGKAFDSDAECAEQEDNAECRNKGNVFVVRFEEPGTYRYYCKFHADPVTGLTGMVGTIEVEPAPEPSESETGSSEPPSEGSSAEPEPREEPSESSPEPREEPSSPPPPDDEGSEPQDEGTSEPATDDAPPARRAPGRGFGIRDLPEGPTGPGPEVAPENAPSPSFSPFPSAPEPSASDSEDMAVTVPGRGGRGPSRGVVVGVAIASVIGSAGALGKVVLFGQPWT